MSSLIDFSEDDDMHMIDEPVEERSAEDEKRMSEESARKEMMLEVKPLSALYCDIWDIDVRRKPRHCVRDYSSHFTKSRRTKSQVLLHGYKPRGTNLCHQTCRPHRPRPDLHLQ